MEKPGQSIFDGIEIGIGTWSWGDRLVWNYGKGYSDQDIEMVFKLAVENGIRFFDTAEIYGQGKSESFLGKLAKATDQNIKIASKFMPYPWRFRKSDLDKALHRSLERLDRPKIDLYQIHTPFSLIPIKTWMAAMLKAQVGNLIGEIGVSNYDLQQTMEASEFLQKNGSHLASNQVEYNLLDRRIEKSGLLNHCKEMGIKVIAYSPLAMGVLTGKYTPENPPSGPRGGQYNRRYLEKIQPLIKVMKKIAMNHEGKTAAQVAINWVICKGALPIPGAKTAVQLEENISCLSWRLNEEEVNLLDDLSESVNKKE